MAAVGIVLVFEAEYHVAFARLGRRRRLYGQSDFVFLAARCLRKRTPVGYRRYFPVAFGIYNERLLVLGAQCAGHRRTAYKLVVGGYALEIAPTHSRGILCNRRLGYFESEVVLGHAVEGAGLYVGRNFAFAHDRAYAEAILECAADAALTTDGFKTFGKDEAFKTAAVGKCAGTDGLEAFGKFESAHKSPVVGKCFVSDCYQSLRQDKFA